MAATWPGLRCRGRHGFWTEDRHAGGKRARIGDAARRERLELPGAFEDDVTRAVGLETQDAKLEERLVVGGDEILDRWMFSELVRRLRFRAVTREMPAPTGSAQRWLGFIFQLSTVAGDELLPVQIARQRGPRDGDGGTGAGYPGCGNAGFEQVVHRGISNGL